MKPEEYECLHEYIDIGADDGTFIPQDVCILCGDSQPAKDGEIRTYSNNQTVYIQFAEAER